MIIMHPCTDQFDPEQHLAYVEFFHKLLPQTRDAMELHKKYEKQFAKNPAYVQMYRTGKAYHPVHPFYMWYWGDAGRAHVGKVIVVGAEQPHVPERLGWESAQSLDEALERASSFLGKSRPEVTLCHAPPILVADVEV